MSMTTTTQYSGISHTEILGDMILEEARPRNVASRKINTYDIEGRPSGTLDLNRWDDPGRAGSATEGVPFTTTTQLGTGTVSATPTEFAVAQALLSNDSIETRIPGMRSVQELMQQGSTDQKVAALMPEVGILSRSLFETLEYETTSLFSGVSGSVGSTGADMTVATFETAVYTIEAAGTLPHDRLVADLDLRCLYDLKADLRASTGIPFTQELATILAFRPDVAKTGLKGALLGVPVYQIGVEARQTANSGDDVVSCVYLEGRGAPELGDPGGYAGAFAFVQGRKPLIGVEYDQRARGPEIQANWKGVLVERVDAWACKIISDA